MINRLNPNIPRDCVQKIFFMFMGVIKMQPYYFHLEYLNTTIMFVITNDFTKKYLFAMCLIVSLNK